MEDYEQHLVNRKQIEERFRAERNSAEYKKLLQEVDALCFELWGRDYLDHFGSDENETISSLQEKKDYLQKQLEIHNQMWMEQIEQEYTGQHRTYKLKNLWKRAFNIAVKNQPVFCELMYYNLIGQYFYQKYFIMNEKEEDLRIHFTIISPSGIGKSESNDFLARVAKQLGLTVKIVGRVNDASVIGSFSSERQIHNSKNKLKVGDERYLDPMMPGILAKYDIVLFDEGELVLKPSTSNEKIQTTLQTVMNRYKSAGNLVSNDLIAGSIEYHPHCSIGITSYYLDEFQETLITRGLIQRTMLYVQENDRMLRQTIEDSNIRGIWTEMGITSERTSRLEKAIAEFANELKKHSRDAQIIFATPEVAERIISYKEEMRKTGVLPSGQQDLYDSVLSREIVKMVKISALNAVSDGRGVIDLQDVEEMYELFKQTNISTLDFITENVQTKMDSQVQQYLTDMQKRLGKAGYPKGVANKFMAEAWKISVNSAINRMKKLKDFLEHYNDNGMKMVKLK